MNLSEVFDYPAIGRYRRDRTAKISAVFGWSAPAPDSEALDYCLYHHVLEGADRAARVGDTAAFTWYGLHRDAGATAILTSTPVGPRVVISPDMTALLRSPATETPYFVLSQDTVSAPPALAAMTAGACASATGFAQLLADHAAVICLLRARQLGDALGSWTISRLPGTVFTDHTGDPAILGRDLVHEAGHNWLNDALAATACGIPAGDYYSPWKGTARPAFGFIHACWAFPLTMIYTAQAIGSASEPARAFLQRYLDQQRLLLAQAAGDHHRALAHVGDPDLRERLRSVAAEALAL